MGKFECKQCGLVFSRGRTLDYHIEHNACKEKIFPCKHCGKKFSAQSGMYRHIKNNCKVIKANDNEKSEIYEKLLKIEKEDEKKQKIIEKQSEEIKKLKED